MCYCWYSKLTVALFPNHNILHVMMSQTFYNFPHEQRCGYLKHEEAGVVKEAGSFWSEQVDRPDINEVVCRWRTDLLFVQQVEIATKADVFVHLQAVNNQLHILNVSQVALGRTISGICKKWFNLCICGTLHLKYPQNSEKNFVQTYIWVIFYKSGY